jgi:hypothetical protein
MTSAHAEQWDDLATAAADVAPGHPVTVHPPGRPALRLVTPADWALGELYRLFVTYAPPEALAPSAGLATGREPGGVYGRVFRYVGCGFADAERRAIALVRGVDQVLAELYEAVGPGGGLAAVVPQLRQDLVRTARADQGAAVRDVPGLPDELAEALTTQGDWLRTHPADSR